MEAESDAVQRVLGALLPGLDDSMLEYLVASILEGEGGPTRPLWEDLGPFLAASGETEAAAAATCRRLEAAMRQRFATASCDTRGGEAAVALARPIRPQDAMAPSAEVSIDSNFPRFRARESAATVSGDDDIAEDGAGKRTRQGRDCVDGVPLSYRPSAAWSKAELHANGGGRKPRKVHSVGLEHPLPHDAALKVRTLGATFAISGSLVR
mmetsp:Transcript_42004/g.121356  ORF Transcript_42004/g.121356 Transcript_42004/m.121356 type:complete len:210 (+) Transcript_42004:55-684(+)